MNDKLDQLQTILTTPHTNTHTNTHRQNTPTDRTRGVQPEIELAALRGGGVRTRSKSQAQHQQGASDKQQGGGGVGLNGDEGSRVQETQSKDQSVKGGSVGGGGGSAYGVRVHRLVLPDA